jgi:hypothetical protein
MPATRVAGGQLDARPRRVHDAGELPAQAGVFGLLDQPDRVEESRCDAEVRGIDRRRGDGDPDLAGAELGDGHLDDLDRVGPVRDADDGGAECGSTHGFCSLAVR